MIHAAVDRSEQAPAPDAGSLTLDPFSFLPGIASKITGLGGNAPGHDPTYVFHTPYVKVTPGQATLTIKFEGLVAKRGTLVLRIHVLPTEAGAQARLVNSERIALNRLLVQEGEVSMQFEAYRDMTYAVLGLIPDNSDARAESLTVRLDCQQDGSAGRAVFAEARSTVFGSDMLKPTARLISLEPATLAHPASQLCTAAQFDEPAYGEWLQRLRLPLQRSRAQWEQVYVLQVLKLYGMLEKGARGLGFAEEWGVLPAAMAAMGVSVTAASSTRIVRDARSLGDGISDCAIDFAEIPHELVNFDFIWSSAAASTLGSVAAGLRFAEQSMECLRPKGIAVHIFDVDPDGGDPADAGTEWVRFRRRDMEQIALGLISRGHEVAEMKISNGAFRGSRASGPAAADAEAARAASFGLIARKAAAPL